MNILYFIGFFLVLFFGFQYLTILRMKRKRGKPAPELSGDYGNAVNTGKTALFYFYSPRCGACRSMTPVVERFTNNTSRSFKVDVSHDMDTARHFGVMATPSTVVVEKGIIRDFLVGPRPEAELISLLKETQA